MRPCSSCAPGTSSTRGTTSLRLLGAGRQCGVMPSDLSEIVTVQLLTKTLACWAGDLDRGSTQGTNNFASVAPGFVPLSCHVLWVHPGAHQHRGHRGETPPAPPGEAAEPVSVRSPGGFLRFSVS